MMHRTYIAALLPLALTLACAKSEQHGTSGKAAAPSAAATEPAAPRTLVAGKLLVLVPETGELVPAPNAEVYLEGIGDTGVRTSTAGTFSVEIPDGAMHLAGDMVNWYALQGMSNGMFGVEQQNVVIKSLETNELGDVHMLPTAVLRGTVQAQGAESSAGAVVTIPGTIFTATTDVNGQFRIDNIPAATWKMNVTMKGYKSVDVDGMTLNPGDAHDMGTMPMTKADPG